ncbi:MAG: MFS transporter [Chloroflexi bacterium]|nr:MFS transporter [Chloroflexota bacterium]
MRTLRPRLFYGWTIVSTIFIIDVMSMGMGTLNFGLFVNPMGSALGINRSIFGWAQTARMVAGALSGLVMGRLVDRHGPRFLMAGAAVTVGLSLIALGKVTAWWHLLALFAVMGAAGMSGPGSLLTTVPLAKWFVRQRGRAMAIAASGIAIGAIFLLPFTQLLIRALGWRNAWMVLGAIGIGVIVPLSILFLRRQPEDMGLLPDGDPPAGMVSAAAARPQRVAQETSWTLGEALRTPTLWRLVLVFSMTSLSMGSMGVHRIPHFVDRGFDPQLVSYAISLDAGLAAVTTFAVSFILDRVPVRFIGAAAYCGVAGAVTLMIFAYSAPMMFAANGLWGFSMGVNLVLANFMWAQYFGRAFLGTIRGIVLPITLAFGAVGSPLAGYINDATGSYVPIWWATVAGLVSAATLLFFTPPPQRSVPTPQPAPVSAAP